jgi:Protein of unknown function (DUF3732)
MTHTSAIAAAITIVNRARQRTGGALKRDVFKLLHEYCNELEPDMQIIVADHVELLDDWFRGSIAERWRDGIALVPASWLREGLK